MKNPYIYGENSSIATSSVIKIEQNIIINSSVPNIGIATYKNYTPLMNPAYPEKMIYFTYDVTYDGDASIIYMKPDGFHESFKKNKTFYSFFFSSKTFPTTSNFEYRKVFGIRDWTKYGFKVFLPGGICGKGACFLGIKPQTGILFSVLENYNSVKFYAYNNNLVLTCILYFRCILIFRGFGTLIF